MIYGMYLSAQGADMESARLDVVANNLANATTNAFKRELAIIQAHPPFDVENGIAEDPPGDLNESTGGVSLAEVATDFSDGPLFQTGGTYDLALTGPGFLRVSDGRREFLTRDGRLTVDSRNELVTQASGHAVLGNGGSRITVPDGASEVKIASDGTISARIGTGESTLLGKLDLVRPQSFDSLEKVGGGLYRFAGTPRPAGDEVQVQQGFLEGSGTRPVMEMMQLIEASRAFETNLNMIKFQDDALGRLLQTASR